MLLAWKSVLAWFAKIICLVENVSKIQKVANHFGRSLASDEVCSDKTGVDAEKLSAEIVLKSTGFREIVGA